MQWASQYMVFSAFGETMLLQFTLKVRTLISGRNLLFLASRSNLLRTLKSGACQWRWTRISPRKRVPLCYNQFSFFCSCWRAWVWLSIVNAHSLDFNHKCLHRCSISMKLVVLISHLFHRYQFLNQFLQGINVDWGSYFSLLSCNLEAQQFLAI